MKILDLKELRLFLVQIYKINMRNNVSENLILFGFSKILTSRS